MGSLFSTDTVTFDTSVSNPGRICRLYGSINKKGPHSPERPQRQSTIQLPADWRRVPLSEIQRLTREAGELPRVVRLTRTARFSGRGDYATLDAIRWFEAHGLYIKHIDGNKHEVVCPWEHEHSTSNPGDTIIYESTGDSWAGYYCHHDHCCGRRIEDVMALFGDADQFCARQWGAE